MTEPHGATIRQAHPGSEIEIMIWQSGDEPITFTLTEHQALLLAQQCINAVVGNPV